ncbi:MAG: HDOD domain-containing protein [Proteobacteria bacterium]|nr:HDOD domain-containing protein [Pseudomonadota bacterium]
MFEFLRRKRIDPRRELQRVLGSYELPSFPALLNRALDRLRDPDSSLGEVAKLIESDPGLSQKLISLVNSSAYALRNPVRNVTHAASMLGRAQLEAHLLSAAVRGVLDRTTEQTGQQRRRFWLSATRRAAAARAFAAELHPATQSESFTAALLQDMAVPLILQHRNPTYGQLLERAQQGELAVWELEREAYGWDHGDVASWLCNEWSFPEALASAIASHHAEIGTEGGLAAVQLAALLLDGDDASDEEHLVQVAQEACGLASERTLALLDRCRSEADELARLLT